MTVPLERGFKCVSVWLDQSLMVDLLSYFSFQPEVLLVSLECRSTKHVV